MSMFNFGGDDPDQVANLQQQLAECRIDLQKAAAENSMLRERIVQFERPSDMVLLTVKHFLICISF